MNTKKLIITDPCYLLDSEEWAECCRVLGDDEDDWEDDFSNDDSIHFLFLKFDFHTAFAVFFLLKNAIISYIFRLPERGKK